MANIVIKLFSKLTDTLASRKTDRDIDDLKESVRALNYELSLLRYKESDDEDIKLAYEYLKKRPFNAALYLYEKTHDMAPVEVYTDETSKMLYVMHNGRPLYFPKGENERIIRWLYRFAVEDDDFMGVGYRQRSPHAFQSERYHIEEGDVLIDAGGGRGITAFDIDMIDDVIDEVVDRVTKAITERAGFGGDVVIDVGSARGLMALDVIDKVSKVYVVEHALRWQKPLEATLEPYKDKVELVKRVLASKRQKKKKEDKKGKKEKEGKEEEEGKIKIGLVELLKKCDQQRVFVVMDAEGEEVELLKEAKEYLKAAKNPIVLSVCAYHRTTDYEDLKQFFEEIGYYTETQPGYIYTNMYDGHGLHSLRRGIIRASNIP